MKKQKKEIDEIEKIRQLRPKKAFYLACGVLVSRAPVGRQAEETDEPCPGAYYAMILCVDLVVRHLQQDGSWKELSNDLKDIYKTDTYFEDCDHFIDALMVGMINMNLVGKTRRII